MIARINRVLKYYRRKGHNKKAIAEMLGVHLSTLNCFLKADYIDVSANPDTIKRIETNLDKLIKEMK